MNNQDITREISIVVGFCWTIDIIHGIQSFGLTLELEDTLKRLCPFFGFLCIGSPAILSCPPPPPGCLATAGALMYGLRAFHQGKTRQSQLLMRGRIFAQGFTVVAIIFGVVTTAVKSKP